LCSFKGSGRLRVAKLAIGVASSLLFVLFFLALYDQVQISISSELNPSTIIIVISCIGGLLSLSATIASVLGAFRVKFRKKETQQENRKIYGFFTLLSIGVGSTIGSPLFVLIPLNVMQYEVVSVGSLIIATVLSVLMAKVYSDMYVATKKVGLESVGGPSFTRIACGTRSLRYFISRVSMWVSNTTLAAYSKLVFFIFALEVFPAIMNKAGLHAFSIPIAYAIAFVFIGWSVINAALESRILRSIGILQIISMTVMVALLLYHITYLGGLGGWNLSGMRLLTPITGNVPAALVINTGYLYLLFFGFQEIQALERDALDVTKIRIPPFYEKEINKTDYFRYAMILSVVIAAVINILYGLAVFSVHPSLKELESSSIPALYIAEKFGGGMQELVVAVAFLIASITTFVPAFVAASRHLGALCEDGYLPRVFGKVSWVFTLLAIFILAIGNADFLVNITNFLVLLSLGIISLSPVWLNEYTRGKILPLIVGLSCFAAGGAIYFISPNVVVAGVFTFLLSYTIFDILELGLRGTQLFSIFFCIVLSFFATVFQVSSPAGQFLGLVLNGVNVGTFVQYSLVLCSVLQVADFVSSIRQS
jgi:amino acid transporter